MDNKEIQRWLDNADKGIAEGKPQYALASSKNLQRLGRNDLAERALRDAHDIFGDSIQVFRALATIIRERDPREGLKFAEAQAHSFGNNARFQKALALADLQRAPEAIMEIEEILMDDPQFKKNRFVATKLFDLYNDEGRFQEARELLEPLIDQGVYTDVRMKQLLSTVLCKLRESLAKVLELLQHNVDPQSERLKQWARVNFVNGATPLEVNLIDQHPRLHLDEARLAFLREHREEEPWASMLAAVRDKIAHARDHMDLAGSGSRGAPGGQLPHIALCYLIFGDASDLALAREIMHASCQYEGPDGHGSFGGCWLFALGTAFDWLYHDLDQATLDETADYIHRRGRECFESLTSHKGIECGWDTCNHLPNYVYDLAASGMAIYGHRPDMGPQLRFVLAKTRQMIHALGPDGVSQEGICYGGFYTEFFVRTVDLVNQLLANDLFAASDWLANTWAFHQYSMLPRNCWTRHSHLMGFGDGVRYHWHGPDSFLFRMAAYHQNTHAQWLAHELFKEGFTGGEGHYLNPIWCDPELDSALPTSLPTFRHFEDQGMVFMRTNWDGDESLLGFRCGPFSGHFAMKNYNTDIGGGHMHPDAGSFQLFAHGDWLISHALYTRKQTAHRNTILVNGIGQTGENSDWFEGLELRRERRGPRITHAASHETYDVVTADLTDAYEHAAKATHLIRHVVYLKPDLWIIIDDLAAKEPSTFEALFHSDHTFQQINDRQFAACGETGALQLTCLHPAATTIDCETQVAKGIGAHEDVPMELLRISNSEPASDWVFVTLLEAHRVGDAPAAVATVDRDGGSLTVNIELDGKKHAAVLAALGNADPVIVTTG